MGTGNGIGSIPVEGDFPPAPVNVFSPPTLEDVRNFAAANGLQDDAEKFCAYYAAQDWHFSNGQAISNWEAAYRRWITRDFSRSQERRVLAQQYEQRDYREDELAEILGVDSLFQTEKERAG